MANELEALEKRQLSAQRSLNDLTDQLTLADHLVYKKYLAELQNYGMVTLSQEMLNVQNAADCIRMYQLKELTLKKGEDMFQKLSTVYYSSMAQGCSLAVMIDVPEENVGANIYLGVREDPSKKNMKSHNLDTSSKTLQKVLRSNFPGSEARGISLQEEEELLDGAFGDAQEAVASVSCVAALRDKSKTEDKAFVQGIERFMDAMDGEVYTAMFLAEPVSVDTQAEIRSGYENLYSSLSPFRKSTWSYSENQSTAVMESLCSGTSHTISDTSIRRSFERLQEGKFSKTEKKLTPDIKQSFEHLQKDVSASERMSSGVAKSFEKLEPEQGTRYNDSGAPYRMEQDLLSDAEYKRNGYEYTTDHLGRLFTAEGNLHLKEHDGRLQIKDNIHDIGKGYEKSTDDRGHAIADRFDGANDLENLVPQDAGLNRNEFKNFESKLAQELEAGKQVYLKLEMHYPGDSFRPDAITAETTINGKQEVKVFLNDKY